MRSPPVAEYRTRCGVLGRGRWHDFPVDDVREEYVFLAVGAVDQTSQLDLELLRADHAVTGRNGASLGYRHQTWTLWRQRCAEKKKKTRSEIIRIDAIIVKKVCTYACRFRGTWPSNTVARLFGSAAAVGSDGCCWAGSE